MGEAGAVVVNAGRPRILAVGAQPRNLDLLAGFLGGLGYDAVCAATLEEFDRVIEAAGIDLALVDISGFDASVWSRCARLREAGIPLLVISPRRSAAIEKEGAAHGARGTLVKPLAMRELAGMIDALLGKE